MLTLENTTGIMVPTPATSPRPGGLYAAANLLDMPSHGNLGDSGMHFESNAAYQVHLVDADEQDCITTAASIPDGFNFIGTQNFTVYAAVKCTGFGNTVDDFANEASTRLAQAEEQAVENYFWSTILTNEAQYVTGALSPKRAAGRLESAVGQQYLAQPTLHFGHDLAIDLRDEHVFRDDLSTNGSRIANGAGYWGTQDKDGDPLDPGTAYLYATGQVTVWRGPVFVKPAFDTTNNQLFAVAARPIAIAIDGPVYGATVTLDQ